MFQSGSPTFCRHPEAEGRGIYARFLGALDPSQRFALLWMTIRRGMDGTPCCRGRSQGAPRRSPHLAHEIGRSVSVRRGVQPVVGCTSSCGADARPRSVLFSRESAGTILLSGPRWAIASFGSPEGHSLSVGTPRRAWAHCVLDALLRFRPASRAAHDDGIRG